MKKTMSLLLALLFAFSLCVPGLAFTSTFTDITDEATAYNAETLRMLGVVDGTGGGRFQPGGTLTRAQFCKMAVAAQQRLALASQYQQNTIFTDVTPTHWACGVINLAAKGEQGFIQGFTNGSFQPNSKITFGQAVAILLRILGYKDVDVGIGIQWYDGYLSTAKYLGLTEGLNLGGESALTRAQAAKLFTQLLTLDTKEGQSFLASLGFTTRENVLVFGKKDAKTLFTATGEVATLRDASDVFAGVSGTLVLDSRERAVAFLPKETEAGSAKTVTVLSAEAGYLITTGGEKITISPKTPVYRDEEETTYEEVYLDLKPGDQVTVYRSGKKILSLVVTTGATLGDVMVASSERNPFDAILNGAANYTILKNGLEAAGSDIRLYDVGSYDSTTRVLRVTDNKITGIYEDVYPNEKSPMQVTVMGIELPVLDAAREDLQKFKLGDAVTLLLSADNQVAGVVDPTKAKGTQLGLVKTASGDAAQVELLCGLKAQGNPSLSDYAAERMVNQLVFVNSYQKGRISLTKVSGTVADALDLRNMTLGGKKVLANASLYERVGDGPMRKIAFDDLAQASVPAKQIVYAGYDYKGQVNVLVFDDVTGDGYHYGFYKYTPAETGETVWDTESAKITVVNGATEVPNVKTGYPFKDNVAGGIAAGYDGTLAKYVDLAKLTGVTRNSFNGSVSLSVGSTMYPIAENVQCYIQATKKWVDLRTLRGFSDSFEAYYDRPVAEGGKIRLIVAK